MLNFFKEKLLQIRCYFKPSKLERYNKGYVEALNFPFEKRKKYYVEATESLNYGHDIPRVHGILDGLEYLKTKRSPFYKYLYKQELE
jgi:hypothetical protein